MVTFTMVTKLQIAAMVTVVTMVTAVTMASTSCMLQIHMLGSLNLNFSYEGQQKVTYKYAR